MERVEGIVFDIDGTVARGRSVLPGVLETLAELRRRGIRYAFLTNDNTHRVGFWVERLAAMGIAATPEEVVTAALVAAEATAQLHPGRRVLPVGDVGLREALAAKGLELVGYDDAERAEVVVMGKDPEFDQRRLAVVCRAIWNGAEFLATNRDPRVPTADGFAPGTGPMVEAVAYATGREPLVTGKPSAWAGRMAMELIGVAPERGAVVGDQLATDIAMGRHAGLWTVLVLSGATRAGEVDAVPEDLRPHVVLDDVTGLVPLLDGSTAVAEGSRRRGRE